MRGPRQQAQTCQNAAVLIQLVKAETVSVSPLAGLQFGDPPPAQGLATIDRGWPAELIIREEAGGSISERANGALQLSATAIALVSHVCLLCSPALHLLFDRLPLECLPRARVPTDVMVRKERKRISYGESSSLVLRNRTCAPACRILRACIAC